MSKVLWTRSHLLILVTMGLSPLASYGSMGNENARTDININSPLCDNNEPFIFLPFLMLQVGKHVGKLMSASNTKYSCLIQCMVSL